MTNSFNIKGAFLPNKCVKKGQINYSIFKSVRGFLKRVIISTLLVCGSLCVAAISPEAKNTFAGAILFLFVPSMFISTYLLYKSKPALNIFSLIPSLNTIKVGTILTLYFFLAAKH
mgnify:CR=1 FL=1